MSLFVEIVMSFVRYSDVTYCGTSLCCDSSDILMSRLVKNRRIMIREIY